MLKSLESAYRTLDSQLEVALGNNGLSIAKLKVLRELAGSSEPLQFSQLAERLACVKSNITQLVDRLEQEGLVKRIPDSGDRRCTRASLTERGLRRYQMGVEAEEQVQVRLLSGFTPQEQEQLRSLLVRFGK